MAGIVGRIVAGVVIAGVLVAGGALGLNACDSNYPRAWRLTLARCAASL